MAFCASFTPWRPIPSRAFTQVPRISAASSHSEGRRVCNPNIPHVRAHARRDRIVYGDIGTSPLYAFREALAQLGGAGVGQGEILGILSLMLWALIIVVTIKYVLFLTRADNNGEGAVLLPMALATLAHDFRTPLTLLKAGLANRDMPEECARCG